MSQLYWYGLTTAANVEGYVAGSIYLPRHSGSDQLPGKVARLAPEHVELVRDAVPRCVVRPPTGVWPAKVPSRDSPRYQPRPGDRPLAEFVWLHALDDAKYAGMELAEIHAAVAEGPIPPRLASETVA